jgi:hypothetical protein
MVGVLFVVVDDACPERDIFWHASCVSMGRPPVYARHAMDWAPPP